MRILTLSPYPNHRRCNFRLPAVNSICLEALCGVIRWIYELFALRKMLPLISKTRCREVLAGNIQIHKTFQKANGMKFQATRRALLFRLVYIDKCLVDMWRVSRSRRIDLAFIYEIVVMELAGAWKFNADELVAVHLVPPTGRAVTLNFTVGFNRGTSSSCPRGCRCSKAGQPPWGAALSRIALDPTSHIDLRQMTLSHLFLTTRRFRD